MLFPFYSPVSEYIFCKVIGIVMTEKTIRVLLVEDNPEDVILVKVLLNKYDANIEVAANFFECNERLTKGDVDVVLLDLSLPDSKGLETFKMAYSLAPKLPFVLLTGNDDQALAIEAVRAGAEDYLVKGEFEKKLLWRVIRYAIERKLVSHQVREALKRAQESDLLKSRFVSKMSHDFRTPINAILGMASLLSLKPDMDASKRKKFIERIKVNGNQLLNMVDSILEMMKIDSGKIKAKRLKFNIHGAIHRMCETYKIEAEKKSLEFIYFIEETIPEFLLGDPLFFERVINNLVINAIQYTKVGSVALEIFEKEKSKEKISILFKISDTGVGIEESDIDKIFDSFFQAEYSLTEEYSGAGLGLSIARELAEMMGGEIWVESKKGRGSVFNFICDFAQIEPDLSEE